MAEGAAGVEMAAMVDDIEPAPWKIDYDRTIKKTCKNNNFVHPAKKYPLDRASVLKSEYDRLSTFQQQVWKTMWKVWKTSGDMKFILKIKSAII